MLKNYAPKTVIIAADNDGLDAASRKTADNAVTSLRKEGFQCVAIYPDSIGNKTKTDWNDVLLHKGKTGLNDELKKKEQIALSNLKMTDAQLQKKQRQARFDQLKQDNPVLCEYEKLHIQCMKSSGYQAEKLEKSLQIKAKQIMVNKPLLSQLKQELPKFAQRLIDKAKGREREGWER